MKYSISIRVAGTKYGWAIRDGRNSTVLNHKPDLKSVREATTQAAAAAAKLIARDKLLGRRSFVE